MHQRAVNRRFTAWLAAGAILLGALVPLLSQWLAAPSGAGVNWIEVCATTGIRWIAFDTGSGLRKATSPPASSQDPPAEEHGQAHCPFCLLQAHHLVLPPQPTVGVALITGPDSLPFLFLSAPEPLFAWSSALARAPPALS